MSRLLTFLLFVLPFVVPAQDKMRHVEAGNAREEQGYLAAALGEYRQGMPLPAAMNGVASIEVVNGNYDSVLYFLKESRALDDSPKNLLRNYQVEAKYWQAQNENDRALSLLQQARDLAISLNDVRSHAIIESSIGTIYFGHDLMQIARGSYMGSNTLCDSSQHADIIARNYARIANTYMVDGNDEKAKQYLNRAKKIADLSTNLPLRSYVLSSMAIILFNEGRYDECIAFMEEPILIKRKLGQARQLQNDLLNISETYMMVKDYGNSRKALDEGMSIAKSLDDIVYLKYFHERASALDSVTGNYQGAYTNLRLAMMYKDSAFSAQKARDLNEIQQRYEAEQKEKIIAEKEVALSLTLGSSIIAILLLFLVLIIVRARNRRQRNQLRLQTIVKTQEEVQHRIARDLHDGLVQVLGAAKVVLQSVGPASDRDAIQKQIHNACSILDEAVNETRAISHQVLPYSLLKNGLVPALEDLFATSLSSSRFEHDDINVNEDVSINIYRIAQELVNNVQKHAPSADVTVKLKQADEKVRFCFSDSGPGFDASRSSNGAGLINIGTRVNLVNGSLTVSSSANEGTTIEVIIPL
jgi:two-component system NarL family sensor kinase